MHLSIRTCGDWDVPWSGSCWWTILQYPWHCASTTALWSPAGLADWHLPFSKRSCIFALLPSLHLFLSVLALHLAFRSCLSGLPKIESTGSSWSCFSSSSSACSRQSRQSRSVQSVRSAEDRFGSRSVEFGSDFSILFGLERLPSPSSWWNVTGFGTWLPGSA